MCPEIVALGEPLLEFNALETGGLRDVRKYEVGWGGDTSNYSIAARRLGGDVGYICRIGDDEFGKVLLDLWQREGVDSNHVIVEENGYTGIYFISRQGDDHEFTYYRQNSAASHFSMADVPADYIRQAKIFHTSGISQAISASCREAIFHAIDLAKEGDTLISYDPNVRFALWKPELGRRIIWETIRQADLVMPSLEDARLLTELTEPRAIVQELLASGPKVVALKLGGEGALVANQDIIEHVPPFKVDVVDTTGAGDTFDAAFAVRYLAGHDLIECAIFANAAASLVAAGMGAVLPIPHKQQVDEMLVTARKG